MQTVDIAHAAQHLSELIEQTLKGDEIRIMQGGQPLVKLVSLITPKKRRKFGSARGLIIIADDFDEPLENFQEYM